MSKCKRPTPTEPTFFGKYAVGDRVSVRIGARPLIPFTIVACVMRATPMYKLDWAEHGYGAALNTVPISEKAIVGHYCA